ncbi:PREDICTED: tetratricopeptide repeat protein 9C [Nanorana parkeri]|uniref:tetratricopeptide repeat protein 9C n=1 Tax=Nanorana parkeri TaxID=125878 RepID=UPI000854ABD0|nr:PREDICTED: tetratricopeptide repeat protein 9C [Nanorana parkeri]
MAEQGGDVEQRFQQAVSFKTRGNACYSEHRWREAMSMYHRALLQLRSLDPHLIDPLCGLGPASVSLTPQQLETLQSLQADCYNNLAACLLQPPHPRYERVYECSLQVLKLQPHNVKALYRAGVSSYHLCDYTTAHSYLTQAASKQPKDANIRQYIQLTDAALSVSREKEKQKYQGMFGK